MSVYKFIFDSIVVFIFLYFLIWCLFFDCLPLSIFFRSKVSAQKKQEKKLKRKKKCKFSTSERQRKFFFCDSKNVELENQKKNIRTHTQSHINKYIYVQHTRCVLPKWGTKQRIEVCEKYYKSDEGPPNPKPNQDQQQQQQQRQQQRKQTLLSDFFYVLCAGVNTHTNTQTRKVKVFKGNTNTETDMCRV